MVQQRNRDGAKKPRKKKAAADVKSASALPMRTGRLDIYEQEFIRKNAENLSVQEMAKELNRREESVRDYIRRKKLESKQSFVTDPNKRNTMKSRLEDRPYYKEIKKQLDKSELKYFTEMWIDFTLQFNDDVLPSEELQIKQWIILDILSNRSMTQRYKYLEVIEDIQAQLDDEFKKPRNERDRALLENLTGQMTFARTAVKEFANEHNKLSSELQKLMRELKGSRQQRIDRIETSATNFADIVKMLEDEKRKKDVGEQAEMMRIAKEKARKKLSEYHEFIDSTVDKPLLDAEIVLREED